MIADLLPVRLWFENGRGVARLAGRTVPLTAPPHLAGLQIEAIDYAPGEAAMVMPERAGWRDMTLGEMRAAEALLAELTKERPDAPT